MNTIRKTPYTVSQLATDTPDDMGAEQHAVINDATGRYICILSLGGTATIDNATAHLFAASPDLALELRKIVEHCETRGDCSFELLGAKEALIKAGVLS